VGDFHVPEFEVLEVISRLPRLLYLGDVPVECSYHGSALLYRLLQDYPPERLRILEPWPALSKASRRLPAVRYDQTCSRLARLLPTRFGKWYAPLYLALAGLDLTEASRRIADFQVEAVLTVHHGYAWLPAARLARKLGIPLHLILHDPFNEMACFPESLRPLLHLALGKVYRQAAARFCVSPYMEGEYRKRHGIGAQVVYPGRAKDALLYDIPPERLKNQPKQLTVAYAGNIEDAYWAALRRVAESLVPLGGRLVIYSPRTREQAASNGLTTPNVEMRGLVKSEELLERLRAEADVLFVPMSFALSDKTNAELSFPSKLTDYTAVALPLLIYGPDYCSAVRWARENPGVAELVETQRPEILVQALTRIVQSAEVRLCLGKTAASVGRKYFSFEVARNQFFSGLIRASTSRLGL
jgi:glycosyltransferase involved in cell wall biosynthesis